MEDIEPLTVSIADTCRILSLGRSSIYRLIGSGALDVVRPGRRTLVKVESIRSFVASR